MSDLTNHYRPILKNLSRYFIKQKYSCRNINYSPDCFMNNFNIKRNLFYSNEINNPITVNSRHISYSHQNVNKQYKVMESKKKSNNIKYNLDTKDKSDLKPNIMYKKSKSQSFHDKDNKRSTKVRGEFNKKGDISSFRQQRNSNQKRHTTISETKNFFRRGEREYKYRKMSSTNSLNESNKIESDIEKLSHIGLSPILLPELAKSGFSPPTNTQENVWQTELSDNGVAFIGTPGSGLTSGVIIKLCNLFISSKLSNNKIILIVVPSRESVLSIRNIINKLNLKIGFVDSRLPKPLIRNSLKEGGTFLVGTPWKLISLASNNIWSPNRVQCIFLDEFHELLDEQSIPSLNSLLNMLGLYKPVSKETFIGESDFVGSFIIPDNEVNNDKNIINNSITSNIIGGLELVPQGIKTNSDYFKPHPAIMVSAPLSIRTISRTPKVIITNGVLTNRVKNNLDIYFKNIDLKVIPQSTILSNEITQQVVKTSNINKLNELKKLIKEGEGSKVIITNTVKQCKDLGTELSLAGFNPTILHGNLIKSDRTNIVAKYSKSIEDRYDQENDDIVSKLPEKGKFNDNDLSAFSRNTNKDIFVVTPMAGLGFKPAGVDHVIMHNPPRSLSGYLNRAGMISIGAKDKKVSILVTKKNSKLVNEIVKSQPSFAAPITRKQRQEILSRSRMEATHQRLYEAVRTQSRKVVTKGWRVRKGLSPTWRTAGVAKKRFLTYLRNKVAVRKRLLGLWDRGVVEKGFDEIPDRSHIYQSESQTISRPELKNNKIVLGIKIREY